MADQAGQGPEQPKDTSGEEKVNELYDERLKKMHDVLFASRDIAEEAKNLAQAMGMGTIEAAAFRKAFKDIASDSQKVASGMDDVLNGTKKSSDIAKDLTKQEQHKKNLQVENTQLLSKTAATAQGLTATQREEIAGAQTQKEIQDVLFKYHQDISEEMREALNLGQEQLGTANDNIAATKEYKKFADGVEKSMGLTGKVLQGSLGFLKQMGVETGEMEQNIRKNLATKQLELEAQGKQLSKMDGLKAITAEVGKGLLKAFQDPLIYVKMLIDAGLAFDKSTIAIQTNMAVSKEEAKEIRHELAGAATQTKDLAVNTERAVAAMLAIQDSMGVANRISAEMAAETVKLTEYWGLTNKEAGDFAKNAIVAGKGVEEAKLDVIEMTQQYKEQTGINFKEKDVMKSISNLSGTIRANLGANATAMAEAVLEAKRLGLELEQVAQTGEALLNFEQSIEAELEAELLTGKQLNLEKARMYALTGDYVNLAKEMNEQVGSFSDFQNMNLLQQNALAKAFGMSRDEMSDMLLDQEAMGKTAEELRAEGKEDVAKRVEEKELQKEFSDAMIKLKQVVVDLVGGPMSDFLNLLIAVLEPIQEAISGVSKIWENIMGGNEELTTMESIMGAILIGAGSLWAIFKGIKAVNAAIAVTKGLQYAWNVKNNKQMTIAKRRELGALGAGVARMAAGVMKTFSQWPLGTGIAVGIAAILGLTALIYGLTRKKAAVGGPIEGPSHSQGGTPIEAEGGEFIINKNAANNMPAGALQTINTTGQLPTQGGTTDMSAQFDEFSEKMTMAINNSERTVAFNDFEYRDHNNPSGQHENYQKGTTKFS